MRSGLEPMGKISRAHLVIRHKAGECIGCCLCEETIPQYFEIDPAGLAVLRGGVDDGVFQRARALRIDQAEIEIAIEGCPVDIIRLAPS